VPATKASRTVGAYPCEHPQRQNIADSIELHRSKDIEQTAHLLCQVRIPSHSRNAQYLARSHQSAVLERLGPEVEPRPDVITILQSQPDLQVREIVQLALRKSRSGRPGADCSPWVPAAGGQAGRVLELRGRPSWSVRVENQTGTGATQKRGEWSTRRRERIAPCQDGLFVIEAANDIQHAIHSPCSRSLSGRWERGPRRPRIGRRIICLDGGKGCRTCGVAPVWWTPRLRGEETRCSGSDRCPRGSFEDTRDDGDRGHGGRKGGYRDSGPPRPRRSWSRYGARVFRGPV